MSEQEPAETTQMLPLARPAGPATGPLPVFVDSTGRRRRLVHRVAVGAFLGAAGYSLMVIWSLLGGPVSPDTLMPFSAPHAATAVQSTQPPAAASSGVPTPTSATSTHAAGTVPTSAATRPSASPSAAASASSSVPARASASPTARRPTTAPSKTSTPGHGH